jgi:hypothetical protein
VGQREDECGGQTVGPTSQHVAHLGNSPSQEFSSIEVDVARGHVLCTGDEHCIQLDLAIANLVERVVGYELDTAGDLDRGSGRTEIVRGDRVGSWVSSKGSLGR